MPAGTGLADHKYSATEYFVSGTAKGKPYTTRIVVRKPDDRARFAQQSATAIPGLREARITLSEPIRIDGSPGYETRIDAVSGKDNTPVTVVQWLRFGGANVAMRVIGSSPKDQWESAFPRFRKVRDGLKSRG